MSEPADGPSLRLSPSHLSTVTLEDLELLLTEGLVSAETSERDECSGRASGSLVPEQDTSKLWKQLEQWFVPVCRCRPQSCAS
uniref:Coiled-coil domain containing 154 n=1 Tax=Mus musculus TaxID=10090 RepID=S4R2I6_MOUSE